MNENHPSNCVDLNGIGYTLNGFYLVKSKKAVDNSAKLQSVFCDFKNSLESSITKRGNELKSVNSKIFLTKWVRLLNLIHQFLLINSKRNSYWLP